MKVNDGGGNSFQHPEPGTYSAICTGVIDLGTQESTFEGKTSARRKVMLRWELSELMTDGRPFTVSMRYTASLNEKATLRKHLEAWRGRPFTSEELASFDLARVLGQPCIITLVKSGEYTNVASVAKLMKGQQALEVKGSLTHLDLDNFSPEVYATLSDGLKATIAKSPEYTRTDGTPPSDQGQHNDDIPF